MKVLHVCTFNNWGASIAAIRLHYGLLKIGVDSNMLFLENRNKENFDKSFYFDKTRSLKNKLESRLFSSSYKKNVLRTNVLEGYNEEFEKFSFPFSFFDINEFVKQNEFDVINLHWVSGFLDYSFFKRCSKPIVWTLHDLNPFTGGCHYSAGCLNYKEDCAPCFQLEGVKDGEMSYKNLLVKKERVKKANLHIVALSNWLYEKSLESSLFKHFPHSLIPNGLDLEVYKFIPKLEAKQKLNLPLDRKIFLFVSSSLKNSRKGFHLLTEAVSSLETNEKFLLLALGASNKNQLQDSNVHCVGEVESSNEMNLYYAAADAYIIPSIEDNYPNVVIESLASGTPVLGFSIGGLKDIVIHGENGLLASDISTQGLSGILKDFLEEKYTFAPEAIRAFAELRVSDKLQASKYNELYLEIVGDEN